MAALRTPWQGVANIVRFNWHFYALAAGGFGAATALALGLTGSWSAAAAALAAGIALSALVSLGVSHVVYDRSPLYALRWLPHLRLQPDSAVVNIHAGFDETSALLQARLPETPLRILDFYDPARHTEIAIRRARRAYPADPRTEAVSSTALPLAPGSVDAACVLFAAHEIRDEVERVAFFRTLARGLRPGGRVAVTEHLRDWRTLLAYNVGFLHFYSRVAWERVFAAAGLRIVAEDRSVPLVSTFVLETDAA